MSCEWYLLQQFLTSCAAKDMSAEPRRKAFERLLQNVLAFPTRAAVIVFMVYPHSDDFTRSAENDMLVIAQHYRVPVLSTRCICGD